MKAIIWTKYGSPDGLELREVATPTPADDQVRVRVHATTAATPDTEFRRLKLPFLFALPLRLYIGLIKPSRITILGTEFAGEIESVGKEVRRFKPGDAVFGYTGLAMGAYAEFMCLSENPSTMGGVFGPKPGNLRFEQAAATPFGGLEALHALKQVNIRQGQTVLINGAGGSIGTAAVQLALHYGARVTAIDRASKLDMLRELGAEQVIDYASKDMMRTAFAPERGERYDVILDTVGKLPYASGLNALKQNGYYLNANPGVLKTFFSRGSEQPGGKHVIYWRAGYTTQNILALRDLLEAGALKPVIDRTYPLEQIADAHRYVDSDEKKGNVVITVG
jgi:NADPH:quinone reductase-like Zn-dependent oxidoreductase